jgi:hypothetical protein
MKIRRAETGVNQSNRTHLKTFGATQVHRKQAERDEVISCYEVQGPARWRDFGSANRVDGNETFIRTASHLYAISKLALGLKARLCRTHLRGLASSLL